MPLERTHFALYRERGQWYTPALADWLLHKGVLMSYLYCDEQAIAVFNTHLTANYRGDWNSSNRYVRTERSQLHQLAQLVAAQPADMLVVVAGDFNIPRGSRLYHDFVAESGLYDPLADDTCPTYRTLPGMPARYSLPIDFVFVRVPQQATFQIQSRLCFQEKLPLTTTRQGYLSDHYGVALSLSWETQEKVAHKPADHPTTAKKTAAEERLDLFGDALALQEQQ